jgi:hypothetical protein
MLHVPKKKAKVVAAAEGSGGASAPRSSQEVNAKAASGHGGAANGVHGEDRTGKHRKYDANAVPPWNGGDVKPFLYGRKVVFVLQGRRLAPIWR